MKGFQAKYTVCIFPVLSSTPARSPLVGPYHAANDTEKLNSVDAGTTGRRVPCYDVFHLLVWVSTSGMWSWTGDVAGHFPSASLCHFGFLLCSLSESWPLCAGQPDSAWVVKLYLNSTRVPEQVMCWDTIQNASHSKSNCKRSVAAIPGSIWAILFCGGEGFILGAFQVTASGKEAACQCRKYTKVWSLDQEDPLEEEMATHPSIVPWRIPWTEEPGRPLSMRSQRVKNNWACRYTWTILQERRAEKT